MTRRKFSSAAPRASVNIGSHIPARLVPSSRACLATVLMEVCHG